MFLSAYSLHLTVVQIVLLHPNPPAPPLTPLLLFAVFLKPKSLWGFPPTMVGRVCVVIGAGPGLGIACARRWAREGYKVPDYYQPKCRLSFYGRFFLTSKIASPNM